MDPRDDLKCGIQHVVQFYLDKFFVFGAVNGTIIFERISDAIRYMLKQQNIEAWNFIDNTFAAIEAEGAMEKFKLVFSLIRDLGLPLNPDKLQEPSHVVVIMGITVDVVARTPSFPLEKMREICNAVEDFCKKTVHD